MDEHDFIRKKDFQKVTQILEEHLDFKHWGFKLTDTSPILELPMYFVYQSEQCKIRFTWMQDRPWESSRWMMVAYGRLHAPLDQDFMIWKGRKCLCWHHIYRVINFLDGVSPMEAEDKLWIPRFIHDFYDIDRANIKTLDQTEFLAKLTAHIWDRYGQRIFNLFDIRQTDPWNQYVDFVRDIGKISEEKDKSRGVIVGLDTYDAYRVC